MKRYFSLLLFEIAIVTALNLDYLDPEQLQTRTRANTQQNLALQIINKYTTRVTVEVNPLLFSDHKDVFSLRTANGTLQIRASTGVAALWGFNYYLKKYCKSQIAWQVPFNNNIPSILPEVDEVVVANDRFRYYQNVCTASYSFVWWRTDQWIEHIEWMALNGINLALTPIAQEYAWAKIYRQIGMTDDEMDEHFTGPAFLSWLRMGNVRGWGGPLPKSWHEQQKAIQDSVLNYMFDLGMVPVLPAFNGHVPRAFSRIFSNSTFHTVNSWNKFSDDYCCSLFLDPSDPVFKIIGKMFLREITIGSPTGHIYAADPFNEVKIEKWSTSLVQETAESIFSVMSETDNKAVWLLQNWMFVHDPILWPKDRVKSFLTSVPKGRMLVLDLQSEQWPQFQLYEMYFGQPFIWCMLHNFGGTLGMFGSAYVINRNVYEARSLVNNTMIGIGLTPEGINQNYVIYDLMLETAWRKEPVADLDRWVTDYAERRYGCNSTAAAWKLLLRSVYSFDGLNRIRGKYVTTRRPSLKLKPWAWYKSRDLFEAFKKIVLVPSDACVNNEGFYYDLVDITRQALQYRAEQLYVKLLNNRYSSSWVFNATRSQFLEVMDDTARILATNENFKLSSWLSRAKQFATNNIETYLYDMNARNQITLWGPNGEITDYACKQWAEVFDFYYIPRWRVFLSAVYDAKVRNEAFDEKETQEIVRSSVEEQFISANIPTGPRFQTDARILALELYEKWAYMPDLNDLPNYTIKPDPGVLTTLADVDEDIENFRGQPTVLSWSPTTPN